MSTKMNLAMKLASRSREDRGARFLARGVKTVALLLLAPLGACGVNRALPPPIMPHDYHDRHPVVLADGPFTIDVFPPAIGSRLDPASVGRIRDFVDRYRRFGRGQITIVAPQGGANGATRKGVEEIRRALAAAGIRGNVYVGSYPVIDPNLAAPIRLTFQGIKAKVAGRCGEWPTDLASGGSLDGWQNTTYWNFGCASQATLSAQVADPRDLASPRGDGDSDIEMRMRAIVRMRHGVDPITQWETQGTRISTVGAN